MNTSNNPAIVALRDAIRVVGSQQKLAAIVNKAQGHVSHWLTNGLPSEYAPAIEKATGVLVEELCPTTHWQRIADPAWPHPLGRPLIDVARITVDDVPGPAPSENTSPEADAPAISEAAHG